MKSTKTFPLIAVLGLYPMSNSLSFMAHFISLPEVSRLGVLLGFQWCDLGNMVEAFWQWLPTLGLISPSLDTFPPLPSELGCSNRPAVVFYLAL